MGSAFKKHPGCVTVLVKWQEANYNCLEKIALLYIGYDDIEKKAAKQ